MNGFVNDTDNFHITMQCGALFSQNLTAERGSNSRSTDAPNKIMVVHDGALTTFTLGYSDKLTYEHLHSRETQTQAIKYSSMVVSKRRTEIISNSITNNLSHPFPK